MTVKRFKFSCVIYLCLKKNLKKRQNYWDVFHENLSTCQLCVCPVSPFFLPHTLAYYIEEEELLLSKGHVKISCCLCCSCSWRTHVSGLDAIGAWWRSESDRFLCTTTLLLLLLFSVIMDFLFYFVSFQLSPVKKESKKCIFIFSF